MRSSKQGHPATSAPAAYARTRPTAAPPQERAQRPAERERMSTCCDVRSSPGRLCRLWSLQNPDGWLPSARASVARYLHSGAAVVLLFLLI